MVPVRQQGPSNLPQCERMDLHKAQISGEGKSVPIILTHMVLVTLLPIEAHRATVSLHPTKPFQLHTLNLSSAISFAHRLKSFYNVGQALELFCKDRNNTCILKLPLPWPRNLDGHTTAVTSEPGLSFYKRIYTRIRKTRGGNMSRNCSLVMQNLTVS